MQEMIEAAPKLIDEIGDASRANFESVQAGLRHAGIPYTINPRLVRGLDYYNLTVFEWVSDQLGAQSAICSGGRYDGLFEQLGGKATPGCGFGVGVERVLLLLAGRDTGAASAPHAYVVHQGAVAADFAFNVAEQMRDHGLDVVFNCGGGSFKSQMKKADGSGARYAIIIGDDEAAAREVSVKPLRHSSEQQRCPVADAIQLLRNK
jgi:histidyl-tRNA synthetase